MSSRERGGMTKEDKGTSGSDGRTATWIRKGDGIVGSAITTFGRIAGWATSQESPHRYKARRKEQVQKGGRGGGSIERA
jgi:hypothetical protein